MLFGISRRRDQRVAIRKQERTRRSEQDDALLAASLDRHLVWLDADIADLDRAIRAVVRASAALSHDEALLRSAPGIGPVAATVLIAQLPEPGRISAKAAASPPRPSPRSPAWPPTTMTAAASAASAPCVAGAPACGKRSICLS